MIGAALTVPLTLSGILAGKAWAQTSDGSSYAQQQARARAWLQLNSTLVDEFGRLVKAREEFTSLWSRNQTLYIPKSTSEYAIASSQCAREFDDTLERTSGELEILVDMLDLSVMMQTDYDQARVSGKVWLHATSSRLTLDTLKIRIRVLSDNCHADEPAMSELSAVNQWIDTTSPILQQIEDRANELRAKQ
jgi:hypothetical protein